MRRPLVNAPSSNLNPMYVAIIVTINDAIYGTSSVSSIGSDAISEIDKIAVPSDTGIYSRNTNLNAFFFSSPTAIDPTSVAPLRLIPGINATHCERPTIIESLTVNSPSRLTPDLFLINHNALPVTRSINPTNPIETLSPIISFNKNPSTPTGIVAIIK